MFSHLFTSYLMTDPPPVVSRETKIVETDYRDYLLDSSTTPIMRLELNVEFDKEKDPFTVQTDAPFEIPQLDTPLPVSTNKVVDLARTFVGTKYHWSGTSPSTGFDCSGLIHYVYKQNGIDVPRDTNQIFKVGQEVSLDSVKPGDIICTPGNGSSGKHVKLVSKIEDGQIYTIEAKGKKYGIVESPLTNPSNIITIRRVTQSSAGSREQTLSPLSPDIVQQFASWTPSGIMNLQGPAPSNTNTGKFTSKSNFVKTLVSEYKKALLRNNLDPNYAYMLVSSAALESAWGSKVSGTYNYGGVKSTNGQGSRKSTIDYIPGKGNIRHYLVFRNFSSIPDYCNYMVSWLKSSKRYGSAFRLFSSSQPTAMWRYILRAGYGGGSESNIRNYMNYFNVIYKTVTKLA